jgi:hypothetical protein
VLDRFLGLFAKKRRLVFMARRAELEGDLASAAKLFAEGDRLDEAARVLVLRGDSEVDPQRRRQHYVQAVALAEPLPANHVVRVLARRKRAMLAIAAARDGATSAAARQDLVEAAADLEAIGDAARAAEAYGLAGDVDGEARALVEAGEVERLEEVLARDHARESDARRSRTAHGEIERLLASGRRREALAQAERMALQAPTDEVSRDRVKTIRAARALVPRAELEIRGRRVQLALGDEVTVGRSEDGGAAIGVASHAVSRRHLSIARGADGRAALRDLGSRNGTELRGMRIAGAIAIPEEGIEVRLGGEVPLRAAPSDELPGAIAIDVGGARVIAPLGPAKMGVGEWRVEAASDGWLELVTGDAPPAFFGAVQIGPRTPLLRGDAIAASRGGEIVVRV